MSLLRMLLIVTMSLLLAPTGASLTAGHTFFHAPRALRVPMNQPTIAFRTEHNGKIRVVTVTPRVER